MATIAISGANRGIGLEHVRQALSAGDSVIAGCRNPGTATDLQDLAAAHPGQLRIEPLDVTSQESVDGFARSFAGEPIDWLINNAGIAGTGAWNPHDTGQAVETMDYEGWQKILEINLFGAARVTAALLPNLHKSAEARLVMISSDLGSIEKNTMGTSHGYRTSKAALNMLAKGLAAEQADKGVVVIALSPGWTQTDMGGSSAIYTVEESVAGQRKVISGLGPTDNGRFFDLSGAVLPW